MKNEPPRGIPYYVSLPAAAFMILSVSYLIIRFKWIWYTLTAIAMGAVLIFMGFVAVAEIGLWLKKKEEENRR